MKFKSVDDVKLFLIDIGMESMIDESLSVDFVPSKYMEELFIKKRKKMIGMLGGDTPIVHKDFRKKQQGKEIWRQHRYTMMRGIRKFHKSTAGKRFHRELGRFLATREGLEQGDYTKSHEACKALSSATTHALIELDYYHPVSEYMAYKAFLDYGVPLISDIKYKWLTGDYRLSEEEADFIYRLVHPDNLCESLAEEYGVSKDIVGVTFNNIHEDDSIFDFLADVKDKKDEGVVDDHSV